MKIMRIVALFSALLLFVCPERAATGGGASPAQINQSPQPADVLSPGAPIERELSGVETHSYRIALNSGAYLRVTVAQKGIDVIVKALREKGLVLEIIPSGILLLERGDQATNPILLLRQSRIFN